MEVIRLTEKNSTDCVVKAVEVLQRGGVVLYPTDTLYGLGADAFSNVAVDTIYAIKGREEGKPIHCIVADMVMAERYAEVDSRARALAKRFLPGPLTLVLSAKGGSASSSGGRSSFGGGGKKKHNTGIAREMNTIGIRVPKSDFCLEMVRMFRKPITTTSANVSGKTSERTVEKILSQLGQAAQSIDLVIDAGELPESTPSTVVDLSDEEPVILREGAITSVEIFDTI
ncbi:MAG: L-threonylcarbamoyladenylate synthase [bacterium]|nr:L-threonylcarbamoyladenylate synthase [bacterium]